MDCDKVKPGLRVTTGNLESTRGMLIVPDKIANRRAGAHGVIGGYVAGHGGDVWWVKHDDGAVAPYMFTELEPEEGGRAED